MASDPASLVARFGTPLYVYDLALARQRCRDLLTAVSWRPFRPLYAIKANPCPALAMAVVAEGFGIDAVSPGEVALAQRLGVAPTAITFTENNASLDDLRWTLDQDVLITAGSLGCLERLAALGAREAALRLNPDIGDGEHDHVITAGGLSKFGVPVVQLDEALALATRLGLRLVGCHMHIGSNVLDAARYHEAMAVVFAAAARMPDLRFVDVGGGLGVPYRPEQSPLDLAAVGRDASALMTSFCAMRGGQPLELRLEPGRFLVAECGQLLTRVTDVKTTPNRPGHAGRCFVGCDTGFNHLIRPCLYGSWHPIANLSRPEAPPRLVDVVGNVCESGDVFARARELPEPQVGDLLAIGCAGAYGASMASTYNLRPLPAEVAVDGDQLRLLRPRRSPEDLLNDWSWDD